VDLRRTPGPFGEIDGVLGSDFLRLSPFTVDYAGNRLVFETPGSLAVREKEGVSVPLHVVGERTPFLPVLLNGTERVEHAYKLDTGAGPTIVRLRDLERLGLDPARSPARTKSGLGGAYTAYHATLASFGVAPPLLREDFAVEAIDTDLGFIGASYLSAYVLTLDYGGKRAIFGRGGA
jgi:hypothetical protein